MATIDHRLLFTQAPDGAMPFCLVCRALALNPKKCPWSSTAVGQGWGTQQWSFARISSACCFFVAFLGSPLFSTNLAIAVSFCWGHISSQVDSSLRRPMNCSERNCTPPGIKMKQGLYLDWGFPFPQRICCNCLVPEVLTSTCRHG